MDIKFPSVVKDQNGNELFLSSTPLGGGGQGYVFKTKDKNIAVKILYSNNHFQLPETEIEQFNQNIEEVMVIDLPKTIHVSKPEVLLAPPFSGYLMRLLDSDQLISLKKYCEYEDIFELNKDLPLNKRIEILIELSRTLALLHSHSIVYCDLSPANIFVSNVGNFSKVWLIDCDNMRISSQIKSHIHTPGYGAPEIETGANSNSIYSDIYSFAVIAFRLLFCSSPFDEDFFADQGTTIGWDKHDDPHYLTEQLKKRIYLGDPKETSEKAQGIQQQLMTRFSTNKINDLFYQTFSSENLFQPHQRPLMSLWYEAFIKLYAQLVPCTNPKCQVFHRFNYEKCFMPDCEQANPLLHKKPHVLSVYYQLPKPYLEKLIDDTIQDWDIELLTKDENITRNQLHDWLIFKATPNFNNIILYPGKIIYSFETDMFSINENPIPLFMIRNFSSRSPNFQIENLAGVDLMHSDETHLSTKLIDVNFAEKTEVKLRYIVQPRDTNQQLYKHMLFYFNNGITDTKV